MGVWTTNPKTGTSEWRDEFPDTPEGQQAAQKSTNDRANAQTSGSGSTYNAGGSVANTSAPKGQATTGQTAGDPGSAFGYNAGQSSTQPADRTKSIYEGRDNESVQQWMQRVFRQGTRDYGGALSPDANNPFGRTPYANWFQNRYQDVAPANMVLSRLLQNGGANQDFAPGMQQGMQDFMQNGTGRGFGTGSAGANENLGKLNDLLNDFNGNNTAGLSDEQRLLLGQLNDNPSQANAFVNAQLAGGAGANPFASQYLGSLESRMMNDYFDNPVDQAPNTNGTYLQNLLTKIGARKA